MYASHGAGLVSRTAAWRLHPDRLGERDGGGETALALQPSLASHAARPVPAVARATRRPQAVTGRPVEHCRYAASRPRGVGCSGGPCSRRRRRIEARVGSGRAAATAEGQSVSGSDVGRTRWGSSPASCSRCLAEGEREREREREGGRVYNPPPPATRPNRHNNAQHALPPPRAHSCRSRLEPLRALGGASLPSPPLPPAQLTPQEAPGRRGAQRVSAQRRPRREEPVRALPRRRQQRVAHVRARRRGARRRAVLSRPLSGRHGPVHGGERRARLLRGRQGAVLPLV